MHTKSIVAATLAAVTASYALPAKTSDGSISSSTVVPTTTKSPKVANACAVISSSSSAYYASASSGATSFYSADLDLANACLRSTPFEKNRAVALIEWLIPFVEYQSTLAYLKDPPEGYLMDPVDIMGGLQGIKKTAAANGYTNQYDFDLDLFNLINNAHDGHFFYIPALINVFEYDRQLILTSISRDGIELPEIYALTDIIAAKTNPNLTWTPSAITKINGEDAASYLEKVALMGSNQDPDANYNDIFFDLRRTTGGNFLANGLAPLPDTQSYTISFANKTTPRLVKIKAAMAASFVGIDSGKALYSAVALSATTAPTSSSLLASSMSSGLPVSSSLSYYSSYPASASSTAVAAPTGYPNPVVIHSSGAISGYFLNSTGMSDVAVLAVTSFEPGETTESFTEWQEVTRKFFSRARAAGKTKLLIDLSNNGGGLIDAGYDLFKQLFPTIEPYGASRFRDAPSLNFIGSALNTEKYNLTTSTDFSYKSYQNADNAPYTSWADMYGPIEIDGDNFTSLLRYNLSNIVSTQGLDISGYINLTHLNPQPFKKENIYVLYDGVCASTCTIFSEFLKSQAQLNSIVVGGRPKNAPMQAVGGTKGAEVLTISTLQGYTFDALAIKDAPKGMTLPSLKDAPLAYTNLTTTGPSVNARNNYRVGDDTNTPLQFVYEAADCRIFHTVDDLFDISALWTRAGNVAWGNGRCVPGSTNTTTSSAGPARVSEAIKKGLNSW
ncbi:MAG: hypothetical protein M1834_009720 [Cirrosporium novae-zelandiae]|nr:MAG: hypothetical protein M1834_009720 [Cirrosporium novae-zelandiae]